MKLRDTGIYAHIVPRYNSLIFMPNTAFSSEQITHEQRQMSHLSANLVFNRFLAKFKVRHLDLVGTFVAKKNGSNQSTQ